MNSLSLKNKLIVLIVVLLIFCGVLTIVGQRTSQKIGENYSKVADMNLPDITHLLQGLAHIRAAQTYAVLLAIPSQSESELKNFRDNIARDLKEYDEEDSAFTKIMPEGEEGEIYKLAKEQMDLLKKDYAKALDISAKNGAKESPAMNELRELIEGSLMLHSKAYRVELNKLLGFHQKQTKENVNTSHEAQSSGSKILWLSFLAAILIGGLISYFILKNIISEQEKTHDALLAAARGSNMIEKSPINTMMATIDGVFTYMNHNSRTTLKTLEKYLPEKVENLIGKSIDILHKNPELQRRIIKDPKNLPHKALITVGPEKLDLLIVAINDQDGNYIGPMVTWSVVTEKVELVRDLTKASEELANAATSVLSISSNLSAAAEETSAQANTASVASEEVNAGVQTVASNMEEMVAAIKEITKTTNEAASMTNEAMRLAKNTNNIINKLGDSSMDIGNVIKVISSIAQQTNLLALNATIEAARAGEAGKGFAVVANEVKELANQTAKATSEITKKIETIQSDSKNAVEAIAEITIAIEKVNGYTGNIAASVEEQAATTNEVTRIVTESAEGVKQINENISQVSQAAAMTGKDAGNAQGAAKGVGDIAESLKKYVARLKV